MVYVLTGPVHPPEVAVTLIVAVIGLVVVVVAVKAGVFPEPLAANPMAVLLFVQLNVAPAGVLVKLLAGTVAP